MQVGLDVSATLQQ